MERRLLPKPSKQACLSYDTGDLNIVGNVKACEFLVENGAKINYVNETTGETLIHTLAKSDSVKNDIEEWAKKNIHLFDLNARDKQERQVEII